MIDRRESQRQRTVGAAERSVVGWAGMRGSVSLAAALAIPLRPTLVPRSRSAT